MAKLTLPTVAYKVTKGKKGKWHLMHGSSDRRPTTVCGYLVWTQDAVDSFDKSEFIGFEPTENRPISEIPAKDLCFKCLGAIKAEDEG